MLLEPLLDFIALAVERPYQAALRAALSLSVAGGTIAFVSGFFGGVIGLWLALAYISAGWGLALFLKRRAAR